MSASDPFAAVEAAAARQTEEEKAARAVALARTRLVLGRDARSAFFACLALRLRPEVDWDCGTMATDGRVLAYAPAFVLGLTGDELDGVLAHEVLHCALDAKYLDRALRLGLLRVRACGPGRVIAFADAHRTLLTTAMGEECLAPAADPVPNEPEPPNRRRTAMATEPNGRPDPPADGDPIDPLAEAEALKAALAEAGHRAARLVHALRHDRKARKVLGTAWSTLKALNLGGGDR